MGGLYHYVDLDNYRIAGEQSLQYQAMNVGQYKIDMTPIKTFDLHW